MISLLQLLTQFLRKLLFRFPLFIETSFLDELAQLDSKPNGDFLKLVHFRFRQIDQTVITGDTLIFETFLILLHFEFSDGILETSIGRIGDIGLSLEKSVDIDSF